MYTPLMHAIGWKEKEIIELLLDRGASVNGTDKVTNHTPLHVATHAGYTDTVRMLLEKGAQTDVVGYDHGGSPTTPLLCALELGGVPWPDEADTMDKYEIILKDIRFDLVKLLVDRGCDVNLFGLGDYSPLTVCSTIGDVKLVQLLLQAGAYVNGSIMNDSFCAQNWLLDSDTPKAPVAAAICANKVDITILLVQQGADVYKNVVMNRWTGMQSLLEVAMDNSSFRAGLVLLDVGSIVSLKVQRKIVKKFTLHFSQGKGADEKPTDDKQNINTAFLNLNCKDDSSVGDERDGKPSEEKNTSPSGEFDEHDSENSAESAEEDSEGNDDNDSMPDTFSSGSHSDLNEDDTDKLAVNALMTRLEEVRSLKWYVRTFLRVQLGLYTPALVQDLPLPKSVKEYILCCDLRVEDYVYQ